MFIPAVLQNLLSFIFIIHFYIMYGEQESAFCKIFPFSSHFMGHVLQLSFIMIKVQPCPKLQIYIDACLIAISKSVTIPFWHIFMQRKWKDNSFSYYHFFRSYYKCNKKEGKWNKTWLKLLEMNIKCSAIHYKFCTHAYICVTAGCGYHLHVGFIFTSCHVPFALLFETFWNWLWFHEFI